MKLTYYITLVSILFLFKSHQAFGQVQYGGTPKSFTLKKSTISSRSANSKKEVHIATPSIPDNPEVIGVTTKVNYTPNNSGTWTELENGDRIWQLQLSATGSSALNALYKKFNLAVGSELYFYSCDKKQILGAYNHNNNNKYNVFQTGNINGECAIVELYEPASVKTPSYFEIFEVGYFFNSKQQGNKSIQNNKASNTKLSCHRNINCPEGANYANEKNGVVKITAYVKSPKDGIDGYLNFSGSLINNAKEDGKPLILSSAHSLEATPESYYLYWKFHFNYEAISCESLNSNKFYTLSGAEFLSKSGKSDFLLIELLKPIPSKYNVYFNGWDRSGALPQSGNIIHHPAGDIKKLGLVYDKFGNQIVSSIEITAYDEFSGITHTYLQNMLWAAELDIGATEKGSSGGPFFDQNKKIVGQLTASNTSCQKPTIYFGKLSVSWEGEGTKETRLKDWLDPEHTGITTLNGDYVVSEHHLKITDLVSPAEAFSNNSEASVIVKLENTGKGKYKFYKNPVEVTLKLNLHLNDGTIKEVSYGKKLDSGEIEKNQDMDIIMATGLDFSNVGSVCLIKANISKYQGQTGGRSSSGKTAHTTSTNVATNIDGSLNVCVSAEGPSSFSVNFTAPRTNLYTNENIRLTSNVSGTTGTLRYNWNFGTGAIPATSTAANPTVKYTSGGNKTISLTVTDDNGSVTTTKNSFLHVTSTAWSINPLINGCNPAATSKTVHFSSLGSYGGDGPPYSSYLWNFGDGTTSTDEDPVHTYAAPGTYTVSLTICDNTGCGTTVSEECVEIPAVYDGAAFQSDFLINGQSILYKPVQIVGINQPIVFTPAPVGGGVPDTFKYQWEFDDDICRYNNNAKTATPNAIEYTGLKNQTVIFQHTYTNDDAKFTINLQTTNHLDAVRTTGYCDNIIVRRGMGSGACYANIGEVSVSSCITASSKPTVSFEVEETNCPIAKKEVMVTFNGGSTSQVLPNNKLDFAALGITPTFPLTAKFYLVAYQYDGLNYNKIGTKIVEHTFYEHGVAANAGGNKDLCLNDSVVLGSTITPNTTYKWTGDTELLNSTTLGKPVFNATEVGDYTLTLTAVNDENGCHRSDKITIRVKQPNIEDLDTITVKENVDIEINPNVTGAYGAITYQWTPNINLSSANIKNPVFRSATIGIYEYSLTVTDTKGCTSTKDITVEVANSPSGLEAKPVSLEAIKLSWQDNSDYETGYRIERSVDNNTNYAVLATLAPDQTTYYHEGITDRSKTYYYRVIAIFPEAQSEYSNEASATTLGVNPYKRIEVEEDGYRYGTLSLADYDNDNDLDCVIGWNNYRYYHSGKALFEGAYSLRINDNNRRFRISDNISMSSNDLHSSLQGISSDFGDVDNDGDLDFLTVDHRGVSLFINNNGDFSGTLLSTNKTGICKFFDYDGDNDMDIITSDNNQIVSYINNGSGSFVLTYVSGIPVLNKRSILPLSIIIDYIKQNPVGDRSIEVVDLDNDGDQDFILSIFVVDTDLANHEAYNLTMKCINSGDENYDCGAPDYSLLGNKDKGYSGNLTSADIDNDMDIDVFFCGGGSLLNQYAKQALLLRNQTSQGQSGAFTIEEPFSSYIPSKVLVGDIDNDGDFDLYAAPGRVYYKSNSSNQFIRSGVPVNNFEPNGNSELFDYDNDGDLDMLAFTDHKYQLTINNLSSNRVQSNTPPNPPTNLCVTYDGENTIFSWDSATDNETPSPGLTYNLYIKIVTDHRLENYFILTPMANLDTGKRKIVRRGNVDLNTSWVIKGLDRRKSYEWGVQAIDHSYEGSRFAKSTAKDLPKNYKVCGNYHHTYIEGINITVAPSNCSTANFTGRATLSATNKITLNPGFKAKPEPNTIFKAEISESYTPICTLGSRHSGISEKEESNQELTDTSTLSENLDTSSNLNWSIYPNPNKGLFTVSLDFPTLTDKINISIYDISGRLLKQKNYNRVQNIKDEFNLSNTDSGVYLVKVAFNGNVLVKRMVIN